MAVARLSELCLPKLMLQPSSCQNSCSPSLFELVYFGSELRPLACSRRSFTSDVVVAGKGSLLVSSARKKAEEEIAALQREAGQKPKR